MRYFCLCDSHMLISYLFYLNNDHKHHHNDKICVALHGVSIFLYSLSHLIQQHSLKYCADLTLINRNCNAEKFSHLQKESPLVGRKCWDSPWSLVQQKLRKGAREERSISQGVLSYWNCHCQVQGQGQGLRNPKRKK